MSNEVLNFEEKLKSLLLSKQFFFQKPQNQKVWLYLLTYFLMLIVGLYFDVWYITTLFTVYLLTFILGAKGKNTYIGVVGITLVMTFMYSNIYAFYWITIHTIIAMVIYLAIINRHSKMVVLFYTASLIFFSSALFISLLIKLGQINYNPEGIQNFINNYVNSVINMQPSLSNDKELFLQSFEEIKRFFPMVLFFNIFIYSFVMIQYTLLMLSKDKVIIPVFPKASNIIVRYSFARIYVMLILLSLFMTFLDGYNPYNIENLIIDNLLSLFRWVFVFNGLFTIFFYLERMANKSSLISKILLSLGVFLFSFIYEIIGFIDSIMRFREIYKASKGGKL